jgi:aconitate hydratase
LAPGTEGGVTRHLPDGQPMSIYDAAMKYQAEGVPLVILAGTEYGTGSSRDWAAKGVFLLGVRAALAASFERIHRSNLVGMGVLPLEFEPGTTWQSLGLSGEEVFDIPELGDGLRPRQKITVVAKKAEGGGRKAEGQSAIRNPQSAISFPMTVRIDTPVELDYYRNGGILQTVLRKLLKG